VRPHPPPHASSCDDFSNAGQVIPVEVADARRAIVLVTDLFTLLESDVHLPAKRSGISCYASPPTSMLQVHNAADTLIHLRQPIDGYVTPALRAAGRSLLAHSILEAVDADYDVQTRVTGLDELRVRRPGEACLVVIHAPVQNDLGRRYVLENDTITLGRGRDNDIVLPSDCVSRRHARLERRSGNLFVVDLASTNGTFINDDDHTVRERQLQRGDRLKIGDTIFKYLSGSDIELQYHEIIHRMTVTDGLTDLANRKQLDLILTEEIPRARRSDRDLSLLMVDIDYFKSINDTHGHLTGDSVLRGLATILQRRLRPTDRLGRYGGEEFCVILPETSRKNAAKIGEELRALVEAHAFIAEDKNIRVTISIGVGTLQDDMALADLYRAADEMLYRAKRTGRNKVCYDLMQF
jgi:diguanylate cyclase (GGDEF)-like protein